jgi:phage baseplate assembly protein gpV
LSSFAGLYRGLVLNNDDSTLADEHRYLGRLQVYVPQVYGKIDEKACPWAMPAFAWSGREKDEENYEQDSMRHWELFGLPKKGEQVWIAFECGNPRNPVWLGVCYGEKDPTPELDGEAIGDWYDLATKVQRTDAKYPDIYIMRAGNMWLRFVGDKRLELVYEKNQVFLEFDGEKNRVRLAAPPNWQTRIEGGDVSIFGGNVVRIEAGNVEVDCVNFSVTARNKIMQHAAEEILLESPSGTVQARAKQVSGFEERG